VLALSFRCCVSFPEFAALQALNVHLDFDLCIDVGAFYLHFDLRFDLEEFRFEIGLYVLWIGKLDLQLLPVYFDFDFEVNSWFVWHVST
jgi:hypothetical protein